MTETANSIANLAAALRVHSNAPSSLEAPQFVPLAKSFVQAVESEDVSEAADGALIADACLSIFRIAQRSKDIQSLRHALTALLRAGRFGRILASRFVHSMTVTLRELSSATASMAPGDRLALGHEALLDYPGANDKPTLNWLEELLKPLASAEPTDLAPFVASLGRKGDVLAFPAAQVIQRGLFGKWLEAGLGNGVGGRELDRLCHLVRALDDPALARTMAISIDAGFIAATPTTLRTVADVAGGGDKRVLDMYLKVLKGGKPELAGACIDGVIAQNNPSSGRLLATILMKMPSLKRVAITRIPLLDDAAYAIFLKSLPEDLRARARTEGFAALRGIAPDFVTALTRAGAPRGRGGAHDSQGPAKGDAPLTEFIIEEPEPCEPQGFLARVFSPKQKPLEKLLPKFRNIRDVDVSCSSLKGEEIDGRELTGLKLTSSKFDDVAFVRAKIAKTNASGSEFTGGSFTGCDFSVVGFNGSDFNGTTFSRCSFNNCDFSGAAFSNCTFVDCRFRGCAMGGAALMGCRIRRTGFTASVLSAVSFFETSLDSCRFEDADLTVMDCNGASFSGVEFLNCAIYSASFTGCICRSVDLPGSSVHGCAIHNSDLPHALFLRNRLDGVNRNAASMEKGELPNPKVVSGDVAGRVLTAWSRELTFFRREERMLAANRSRLARAIRSIDPDKQPFVRMLPHLLNSNVFSQKFKVVDAPACDVWGYAPSLTALELANQYFPESPTEESQAPVRILAVYAMGSLGTVAQTAKSDIDCWVCYEGELSLDQEMGLKRKLEALSLWAESEFGLEAHFFPMLMDDVRNNVFSSGDEESSGSAQALLLKEEFYRTALRIAGKSICWWVTPPGADADAYHKCVQATRRYPATGQPRLEDFGHLAPVPPDEYFGGSLWQMVKAVHSPFKSVLKLGLLETYADVKTSDLTLCDRIKHNLFMRRRGVRRTDPYAGLFGTLRGYYAKRGDKGAARLLTESFMFKANLQDIPFFLNTPARTEDASLVRALFGEGVVNPDKIRNFDASWNFDRSLKMGGSVRKYMVSTYGRIQEGLKRRGNADALINPEDLTRMGRRIGSNFAQKQHKVMRVPFMDAKGDGFAILHFSAEKAPGKKPIWVVRGGSKSEAKKSVDSLQLLHRSGSPVHMLAWLLANRIFTPGALLQADRSVAPISVMDLQRLLPAMNEFFPFDETFERDINEGLDAERVTKAFFLFNLTTAPDIQRIETASVIYSTNWGEMFCRTFVKPGPLLEQQPSSFLAKELAQPLDGVPEMTVFMPKGSQVKRINLT